MKSTFERILIATDLSEVDEKLFAFTDHLVQKEVVRKIYCVHIIPNFSDPQKEDLAFHKKFTKGYPLDEKVKDMIQQRLKGFFKDLEGSIDVDVIEGKPYQKLLQWIDNKEVDLVVVGYKEKSEGSGVAGLSRTHVVWASLVVAMGAVAGLLSVAAGDSGPSLTGRSLTPLMRLEGPQTLEAIYDTRVPLAEDAWDAIVIHHSGTPVCTPREIDERHKGSGLDGMGFHFVIGNGRRMTDGEIHMGYRWLDQRAGAHVGGPQGPVLNRSAIGICLVGDGDRQAFTPEQIARLADLMSSLQEKFGIPGHRVLLHRDVAQTTSPGRYFAEAALREALRSR